MPKWCQILFSGYLIREAVDQWAKELVSMSFSVDPIMYAASFGMPRPYWCVPIVWGGCQDHGGHYPTNGRMCVDPIVARAFGVGPVDCFPA
jgi:hypothetical protein